MIANFFGQSTLMKSLSRNLSFEPEYTADDSAAGNDVTLPLCIKRGGMGQGVHLNETNEQRKWMREKTGADTSW